MHEQHKLMMRICHRFDAIIHTLPLGGR